jgi:hypothetical protein
MPETYRIPFTYAIATNRYEQPKKPTGNCFSEPEARINMTIVAPIRVDNANDQAGIPPKKD